MRTRPRFVAPDSQGFDVGGQLFAWGTTLAELDRQLTDAGQRRDGEYEDTPRALCDSAYGFPAISVEPAFGERERPVQSLTYHLAPYDPAVSIADPAWWADAIRAQLGAPAEESFADAEERARGGEGTVFYHASWTLENLQVGLSVFGGQRPESTGVAAAYLYVSWTDDGSAASEYLPQIQAQQAVLDRLAAQPLAHWQVFALDREQYRAQHGDSAQERLTHRALAENPVFDTPDAWSCKLKDREVALWSAGDGHWGLSTRFDTAFFAPGAQEVSTSWSNRLPNRFGGEMELSVGGMMLLDGHSSASLTAIARTAEKSLGFEIECVVGEDNG